MLILLKPHPLFLLSFLYSYITSLNTQKRSLFIVKKVCQDFSVDTSGAFISPYYVGDPFKQYFFYFDIELSSNEIDDTLYNPNHSKSSQPNGKGTLILRNKEYSTSIYQDNLKFSSGVLEIGSFQFHLIHQDIQKEGINSIALSPSVESNRWISLAFYLRSIGTIERICFGFIGKDENKNYMKGQIYFGGIPNEIITSYKKVRCSLLRESNVWGCPLKFLRFTLNGVNYSYYNNDGKYPMKFRSVSRYITAPYDFMLFLNMTMLRTPIEQHRCVYDENQNGDKGIICQCQYINNLVEDITVYFRDVKERFYFNGDEMFDFLGDGRCKFVFVVNPKENQWVFGTWFITKFAMLFDYETKSIEIYGENILQEGESKEINNNNNNQIKGSSVVKKIIINWCSLLMSLMGVGLYYIKYKIKIIL